MQERGVGPGTFLEFVKPIFLKWERLRLLYNLILAVIVLFPEGRGIRLPHPSEMLLLLVGAVLANGCFLAGPVAEAYVAWLGVRSRLVTAGLFVVGVLISIPCVWLFALQAAMG